MPSEEDLIKERLRKLKDLRLLGINPYPYKYEPHHHAEEINSKYEGLQNEEQTQDKAKIAGRIIGLRRMGKVTFMHLKDHTGKVQVYFQQDSLGEEAYKVLKLLDRGDFIGLEGTVFKTKTGEVTIKVEKLEVLTKSLRPLPEKWHGLKDTELRYRQRDVDLIMNDDVKKVFAMRSQIIYAIREFFHQKKFVEVETPVLTPQYGGANARPFTTHHHDLNMELYLRISLELYHKRLIIGGFEKVFEIGHVFRNEGVDTSHNPEFTLLECYQAYADYEDMMELTEDCYEYVAKKVLGTTKVEYQGKTLDFSKPWKKITMVEAIKKYANVDVDKLSEAEVLDLRTTFNLDIVGDITRGKVVAELFDKVASPQLIQPTFILDHPIETTPLCKPCRNHPHLVERFEPFVNGWEIGNAYSELNDPVLQRKLLEDQASQLKRGDQEAHPMDEDFVRAIEVGMPPTGGLGLGLDRMIMFFTNSPSIRDVIFFPTMKEK